MNKHETTRAEFIQAVKNFKKQHQGKLKDLLNTENNIEATRAFLTDAVVHTYLTRPFVSFEWVEYNLDPYRRQSSPLCYSMIS